MINQSLSDNYPNITDYEIVYRIHATKRMFERGISEDDIKCVIGSGIIIEEYKDDFPFPSVLLNGKTSEKHTIHIVLGLDSNNTRLYIITVYQPEPSLWEDNYSRRIP